MPNLKVNSINILEDICELSTFELVNLAKSTNRHYRRMETPKPNGKTRIIHAPSPMLKLLQARLLANFLKGHQWPEHVTGGVKGGDILKHAQPHTQKFMVGTLDVKNFFPTVNDAMLNTAFMRSGIPKDVSALLVDLVTCKENNERILPQGAPTSPFLANYLFLPIDKLLQSLLAKRAASKRSASYSYTRYLDDIAISGPDNFAELNGSINTIVKEHGFTIAPEKVKFMSRASRQSVTSLVVNDTVTPTHEYIRELFKLVKHLYWEGEEWHGPELLAFIFGKSRAGLEASIKGKIAWIARFDSTKARALRRVRYFQRRSRECEIETDLQSYNLI